MKVKKPFNVVIEIDGTEVVLVPVIQTYDKKLLIQTNHKDTPVGYLLTLPVEKEEETEA